MTLVELADRLEYLEENALSNLPIASEQSAGVVKVKKASSDMDEFVGINNDGFLVSNTLKMAKAYADEAIRKAELDDVVIDTTLDKSGYAADAKAVGEALARKQPVGDYALKSDIVQANWEQNDSTAPDYIKNRLAYADITEEVVFAETTLEFQTNGENSIALLEGFTLISGETYNVNINGISFNVTAYDYTVNGVTLPVVGNMKLFDQIDTGESFAIVNEDPTYSLIVYYGAIESGTLSITKLSGTIQQIDSKFIPVATPLSVGGVKPVPATEDMTDQIGVNEKGQLLTNAFTLAKRYSDNSRSKYINIVEDVVYPEEMHTLDSVKVNGLPAAILSDFSLEYDTEYVVIINGTRYEVKSISSDNGENIHLGNLGLIGGMSTNEPFLILWSKTTPKLSHIVCMTDDDITLSILKKRYVVKPEALPNDDSSSCNIKAIPATKDMTEQIGITEDGQLVTNSIAKAKKYTDSQRLGYVDKELETVLEFTHDFQKPANSVGYPDIVLTGNEKIYELGRTFYVYWDDRLYVCESQGMIDGYPHIYIGNFAKHTGTGDTGEPFTIALYTGTHLGKWQVRCYDSENTVHTIRLCDKAEVVHQIDPKFIPSTTPSVRTASVGQTIIVKSVDENGTPTAWEASDARTQVQIITWEADD